MIRSYSRVVGPIAAALKRTAHLLAPTPGNVLFTLLVAGSLLLAGRVGALPLAMPARSASSTGIVPYQGRLTSPSGAPVSGAFNMVFRLYSAASGGSAIWTETWTGASAVQVSEGLFNVALGSLTPIPQAVWTGHSSLWLGVTVGADAEMVPRVQLGTVPYSVQALTVPDGSITEAKLAPDVPRGIVVGAAHASTENGGSTSSVQWTEAFSVTYTPTRDDATVLVLASLSACMITQQAGEQMYVAPFMDTDVGGPWTTTGTDQLTGFSWSWRVAHVTRASHTFSIKVRTSNASYPLGWRCSSITVLELNQ